MNSGAIIAVAFVVTLGLVGAFYYYVPFLPWWIYLGIWAFAFSIMGSRMVQDVANQQIIDRGDWPNKGKD